MAMSEGLFMSMFVVVVFNCMSVIYILDVFVRTATVEGFVFMFLLLLLFPYSLYFVKFHLDFNYAPPLKKRWHIALYISVCRSVSL